ncbi:MAG: hypothetical protein EZS28_019438 [Streblomastix strix]|uniref:Uncharacterized protein n=1 Tax=Streblomastix strix TaxID=222440 RepID=A0A5J4VR81_9EUKA|nr:MAG: hypothetical protein EZS28_019438 [Streblomastix strix]
MKSEQQIQKAASAVVSFTDSYVQNKQGKQIEQTESESILSLAQITSSLEYLRDKIWNNNSCKLVIQIPKLLQSLFALSLYTIDTHISLELNQQRIELRSRSRKCLYWIQWNSDAQDQQDLVNNEYGRVMFISFCTAGGISDENNKEICNGLFYIYWFLKDLHEGRNYRQPSFRPLPLLVRITEEQIEEEGASEEFDAQIKNNEYDGYIRKWANEAKAAIMNRFIHRG